MGDVVLGTVTAPGVHPVVNERSGECWALPWDRSRCTHPPGLTCSGALGCKPSDRDLRNWNGSSRARWSQLHRRAWERTKRRRARAGKPCPPIYDAGAWEHQERGAEHRHLVLTATTWPERETAQEYVDALAELAPRYGFGNVDRGKLNGGRRVLEVIPGERAARYVAKYLAPLDGDGKPSVSESAKRMRGHVVYVARRLTDQTGVTMRTLRERRVLYVISKRNGIDWAGAITLRELQRGRELEPTSPELLHLAFQLRGPPAGGADVLDQD